jgi:hypothetical protein
MHLPPPSIPLLMAIPSISHLEPPHLASPNLFLPFDPTLVTPTRVPAIQPELVIPQYDLLIYSTPSSYARLFDEVSYGHSPTTIDESTTRFV